MRIYSDEKNRIVLLHIFGNWRKVVTRREYNNQDVQWVVNHVRYLQYANYAIDFETGVVIKSREDGRLGIDKNKWNLLKMKVFAMGGIDNIPLISKEDILGV